MDNKKYLKSTDKYSLISKQLFFFFLIVSGNYIGQLMSCSIQFRFSNNRYTAHILGLMTMYFFVTFVDEDKFKNPSIALILAIILYVWFILISLTAHKYTLLIIVSVFLIYLVNNIFEYHVKQEYTKDVVESEKIKKFEKHKQTVQVFLLTFSIILTIYGFLLYLSQKRIEYGKDFNYFTFFLGKPKCNFNGMGRKKKLKDIEYLKKLFIG